jgi:hypothetical protein
MSEPDYAAAWRDLRGRRVLFWALFLGFIPGLAGLCFAVGGPVANPGGSEQGEALCGIFALLWVLVFAVAAIRLTLFRCPRCRALFHSTWWRHNPFSRNCLHCGLSQGTTAD